MIDEGDRPIAVGVSGGKDSMLLLRSLQHFQLYYPKRFRPGGRDRGAGF
jgi:tRNA(Ile)-lysidine synthase TilS/MesJ